MGIFGSILGSGLGAAAGQYFGGSAGRTAGQTAGGALGQLLPFEKGGMVKHTGPAYLHSGEMVVPKKFVKDVPKSLKRKVRANGGRNM